MNRKSFFRRILGASAALFVPRAILNAKEEISKETSYVPAYPFMPEATLFHQMQALMEKDFPRQIEANEFYWVEYDSYDMGFRVVEGSGAYFDENNKPIKVVL